MTKRVLPWALFLLSTLLLSFAATPYSRIADAAHISLRLTLVAVLSILVIREKWRNRNEPPGKAALHDSDAGERLLQRMRSWH